MAIVNNHFERMMLRAQKQFTLASKAAMASAWLAEYNGAQGSVKNAVQSQNSYIFQVQYLCIV